MKRIDFENPWLLALAVVVPLALIVLRFTLVDSPRVQFALSAMTRCVILGLVVLGLGSLLWVSRSEKLSVLVLADLSDSVAESAPSFTKTCAATPVPSRINPRRMCSVPM